MLVYKNSLWYSRVVLNVCFNCCLLRATNGCIWAFSQWIMITYGAIIGLYKSCWSHDRLFLHVMQLNTIFPILTEWNERITIMHQPHVYMLWHFLPVLDDWIHSTAANMYAHEQFTWNSKRLPIDEIVTHCLTPHPPPTDLAQCHRDRRMSKSIGIRRNNRQWHDWMLIMGYY